MLAAWSLVRSPLPALASPMNVMSAGQHERRSGGLPGRAQARPAAGALPALRPCRPCSDLIAASIALIAACLGGAASRAPSSSPARPAALRERHSSLMMRSCSVEWRR